MRRLVLAFAVVLAGAQAMAQMPLTMSYQGFLTDNTGVPVNGEREMIFAIYAAPAGGGPMWQETHTLNVLNGRFDVVLGNFTSLGMQFDAQYWLGIRVGLDAEMTPRQALAGSPYAMRAGRIDVTAQVQGSQITGTISTATVPGVAPWVTVSGTSQLAASNIAYLTTGATLATVTLPAAPAVGDIVKVSSPGVGGFRIAPNAGQSLLGGPAFQWTPVENSRAWHDIAASSTGSVRVAVVFGGLAYTSFNSGQTWNAPTSGLSAVNRDWDSIALSSDGTKAVASVFNGQLYTSTNAGQDWTPREAVRSWQAVASSADGTKLVAVASNGGQIYVSPDSGVTWFPRDSPRTWRSVASSADGIKLVAVVNGGQIYTSEDSGDTWTARASTRSWNSVASSADGTKLVASSNQIFTSADSGVTWTPRESVRNWVAVASSSDGAKLVAAVSGGRIYTSEDSGETWVARESARSWQSVASSADGTKLTAVENGGRIYSGSLAPTFSGGQGAAVELVYSGGGVWTLVNQQGSLTVP